MTARPLLLRGNESGRKDPSSVATNDPTIGFCHPQQLASNANLRLNLNEQNGV